MATITVGDEAGLEWAGAMFSRSQCRASISSPCKRSKEGNAVMAETPKITTIATIQLWRCFNSIFEANSAALERHEAGDNGHALFSHRGDPDNYPPPAAFNAIEPPRS